MPQKHIKCIDSKYFSPNNSKQVENCSKFWFQPTAERQTVAFYVRELNRHDQEIFVPCTDDDLPLNHSTIYVARNHCDKKFYRARLIGYDFNSQTMTFKGTVCFIDTGLTQKCELADIYLFTKTGELLEQATMPPRCFPCRLAEIQPSTSNISGGYLWDRAAIELFNSYTQQKEVKVEVRKLGKCSFYLDCTGNFISQMYSMVGGMANVFIWSNGINVNHELIKKNFGEPCEENFLSKVSLETMILELRI